ncbi:homeobox protein LUMINIDEPENDENS-like [Actinidia eriantha]|uniref:homeobox protein LUMINIDEPENDENS-like n=1 Tax=Actinidia eriantha TaxID=165200 RepID=UPI002589625E|nr:homeobox protein LUMINIDEPENDENS-like [Actinidia eriantha]
MEVLKENQLELAVYESKPSFQGLLDSQQELLHSQIDHLHNIVSTQCQLTGVNPLSQEMAAGALSIKIGKRPRDLLNPKAVKYMQSVFSIKDAISKKESREISALFGVTVTQVREFFTSQRTRVRKFVRLSRDRTLRSNASKEALMNTDPSMPSGLVQDEVPMNTDPSMPSGLVQDGVPMNTGPAMPSGLVQNGVPMNTDPAMSSELVQNGVPMNTVPAMPIGLMQDVVPMNTDPTIPIYPVPLNCVRPSSSGGGPSCSTQEETLPGLDESDRHFVDNIFSLMRKEETFSGQVKLMEWILQIQNFSVLYWFLTEGGVMILATWLSQAASEEQTSVLNVILKVLCHLPLHKALPVHMSAILQSVNSLRFYRTSDISNRARILLSRWSKLFARSQAMKKPSTVKSSTDAQNEMLLKQSISEIMGDESWHSRMDVSEDAHARSFEVSENFRKLEPLQPLKLLPASAYDSSKKLLRGVSSSQTRERRKVLLVEQPGPKSAGRSQQVARSVTPSQERPLSADDIQKAKMRAQFMQSKYGKTGASSGEGNLGKTEGPTKIFPPLARTLFSASKAHVRPRVEERKDPVILPCQVSIQQEAPSGNKTNLDTNERLWNECKRVQIQWRTPAEIRIHDTWRVGTGENSKEVEVQRNRIRREKETFYRTSQEIPSDPKEPWDREMEYDDTLTPEIPTEQLPDCDGGETAVSPRENEISAVALPAPAESTSAQSSNGSMPEPDLELLAVLLNNPELVFALTSGQGCGNLSSEETVKLLDMIKANGVVAGSQLQSSSVSTGLGGRNAEENVQVSLPSPTPSSDPVTSGWRPEISRNPFSRQSATANRETVSISEAAVSNLVRPDPINTMAQQTQVSFPTTSHRAPPHASYSVHQSAAASPPPNVRIPPTSEVGLNTKNILLRSTLPPNLAAIQAETSVYVKPAPISITINTPGRQPLAFPSQPPPVQQHPPPHSWRANQNNYNAFVGDRNEYVGGGSEYESWSPDHSPVRPTEYMPGWNHLEPRMNMGYNHRSEPDNHRSRPPPPPRGNSSSGYRDYNRHGNRRYRDDWRR